MERMNQRVDVAWNALGRLEEALAIGEPTAIERDAVIQRFEFTFEAVWKAAKAYLFDMEGIDVGSPKSVARACREVGLLTDEQTVVALHMTDDRNLTVHTYNEALAIAIYNKIYEYGSLMRIWLTNIQGRL